MRLSISIVTFNNSEIINETLDNLINVVRNLNFILYLIDNNSTDGTLSILNKYKSDFINIIKSKENKGFGDGHNLVLPFLDSDFHIIMNPDIKLIDVNSLLKIFDIFNSNFNIGLIGPKLIDSNNNEQYLLRKKPSIADFVLRYFFKNTFYDYKRNYANLNSGIHKAEFISGAFMVFRTSVFKIINGFDTRFFLYLEDADITLRVNQISNSYFYPEVSVKHTWARFSHKKFKYFIIMLKSLYIFSKKWGVKIF